MSSSAIHYDDSPDSMDSNCDYDNVIKSLEGIEGFDLNELKSVIEKGLENVLAATTSEEAQRAEPCNCASDKLINSTISQSLINRIKSNSNGSCMGRRSSSVKSVSFKDVVEDDLSISKADEHSGKGDEPLTPSDSGNSEIFKKILVQIGDKNSDSTDLYSDMESVKKEGCIQTDSFHSILKHDEFDEMAISETLLALIDQKNKYISNLQNKIHNQKVQLQFYLQKAFNNSTIKALSQTCDPHIVDDNINLNMAMKRFCKREGMKTTLMHLHDHMTDLEANIYDILDNQDTVIQEMAKVLQCKEEEKHSSSNVMRTMSKQVGGSSCYECLQKNYFSLLKLRREMFHFRNSCEKILKIEEERNRIVEQVYSLPTDQRINCNILATIQFDKSRIEEEFQRIKEEQQRIENRLYIGEHLENYFKCMADDGVVHVPLQKDKINEYLGRQLETANSDGLALLTFIHKQKAKYTQELHRLFLANRQLTEKVEQLQKAVEEREALLQKFIYEKHSNSNSKTSGLKTDGTLSDTNILNKSGILWRKKKRSLVSELEEQLQAFGNKLDIENKERGKLEIELSLRSSSEQKTELSTRFNEKSLRLSDNEEKIISNSHHKWKLRTAETDFDKKLKDILDQKEEYLQDIKDLTKIVRGQELQIKHLLVIIDKLRPHIESKEQVNCRPSLEFKELLEAETQTTEPIENKTEVKEACVQTIDRDPSSSKPKNSENRSEIRSVIDVLRECAENVKTIFRTPSSEYSLRSSFKRPPDVRFASQTGEKLVDLPDMYNGSNNTTCLEQLSKEDDSKSEAPSNMNHYLPLMKPLQCLLGLSKHKSESVITVRTKQQAYIDNLNAIFKSNDFSGLMQLNNLKGTNKHIKFAAEIHDAFLIQETDNSPVTSEEESFKSNKKEEKTEDNENLIKKEDAGGSLNRSSCDTLSTVKEQSNEEKSNPENSNPENSNPEDSSKTKKPPTSSSNDYENSENLNAEVSVSREDTKSESLKKLDRSSTKTQQETLRAQQRSITSAKSFKQQKQSSSSKVNSAKPERSFYSKNQEFVVNYITNVRPKSEISIKDKDQKSEKSVSVKSNKSQKSAKLNSEELCSDSSKQEKTISQKHDTASLIQFEKSGKDPEDSKTNSSDVKAPSVVDEILQQEMAIIKKELEALDSTFDHKPERSMAEDKPQLGSSSLEIHDSGRIRTSILLGGSMSNKPGNSETSLTDSEQKTERNIEQIPEKSLINDETKSESFLAEKVHLTLVKDCSRRRFISTNSNSSQTTTTLKVEMTDTEGKLHQISATFESSDELQGIIEIDDDSVVHVKLLCGNMFQQSEIGIEKISDEIVQHYEIKPYGTTSDELCRDSDKEIFREYNLSGVKVCKRSGSINAKAFSVTSVVTEIPMDKSKSSFDMCAEMTDKLKAIVMEIDKKLETPEGKREVLDSLRSLCRLPSAEDASRTNSYSE